MERWVWNTTLPFVVCFLTANKIESLNISREEQICKRIHVHTDTVPQKMHVSTVLSLRLLFFKCSYVKHLFQINQTNRVRVSSIPSIADMSLATTLASVNAICGSCLRAKNQWNCKSNMSPAPPFLLSSTPTPRTPSAARCTKQKPQC